MFPFWVKPAHSFWPEKATLLATSPRSDSMMEQEKGFGSQQTAVQFLLLPHSIIHKRPWSANAVGGSFSAFISSEKNNLSFGQAVVAWVPTQPVPN